MGGQDGCPFLVDGFDLGVDLVQVLQALALEQWQCQGLAAVEGGGSVFHQGAPCGEQFAEVVNGFILCRGDARLQGGAEAGEHGGIDGVGFDAFAGGLQRVELDGGQGGLAQRHLKGAVVSAGGFEDDAAWLFGSDPGDQPGDALAVVGKALGTALWMEMDVELVFRDIDAEADLICRWW